MSGKSWRLTLVFLQEVGVGEVGRLTHILTQAPPALYQWAWPDWEVVGGANFSSQELPSPTLLTSNSRNTLIHMLTTTAYATHGNTWAREHAPHRQTQARVN